MKKVLWVGVVLAGMMTLSAYAGEACCPAPKKEAAKSDKACAACAACAAKVEAKACETCKAEGKCCAACAQKCEAAGPCVCKGKEGQKCDATDKACKKEACVKAGSCQCVKAKK